MPVPWRDWLHTIEFFAPLCETGTDVTIDVAVLYTPEARATAGGAVAIEAAIDLMVAETNQAYEASGVRRRVTLVARSEVRYTESGSGDLDLRRLAEPSDGHLDEVHALRDRVGADLVHLIVAESNVGGIASLVGAFGLTVLDAGGRVFAHELGHNMGLYHDRFEELVSGGGVSPHPAYGYVNQRMFEEGAPPSSRWVTTMSYVTHCNLADARCSWLLRFSNPRQRHNGDPLGIPHGVGGSGVTGPADAATVLAATGAAVALWRDRPAGANQPPVAMETLADRELTLGGSLDLDVSLVFAEPDGDALTFTVSSSAPDVVTVLASGNRVTLTAVGAGTATIRVTATDPGGLSASQLFAVTVPVPPNRPPEPVGVLAPLTLAVDGAAGAVDVSTAFRDPDGDVLTYAARSSAPGVASVSVWGSTATVTPVSEGASTVTVTATDAGGSNTTATQGFTVTVNPPANRPPVAVGTLAPLRIEVDEGAVTVDVSGAFRDPDGDALTYAAVSSAPGVATAAASGSTVTVTPMATGTATVTVTATDTGGSNTTVTQRFTVTVSPPANRPPVAVGTLAPLTVGVDEASVTVEVSGAFRDPDGDRMTYAATSSSPAVATAAVSGSTVTVTPVAPGTSTVTVTATDSGGSNTAVTQTFAVTVPRPFTDHPIVPGVTPVKAVHFTELRARIDALRKGAGLAPVPWRDRVLTAGVTPVRFAHLLNLRSALGEAYAAAGRSAPRWTDAAPAGGATPIRAAHLMELRAAVTALE